MYAISGFSGKDASTLIVAHDPSDGKNCGEGDFAMRELLNWIGLK
jgi:hypothetical protein